MLWSDFQDASDSEKLMILLPICLSAILWLVNNTVFLHLSSSHKWVGNQHSKGAESDFYKWKVPQGNQLDLCRSLQTDCLTDWLTDWLTHSLTHSLTASTLWHFKPPLLILTFTSAASFPRLLEIGIHLQILSFLLLKEQKTLLLSSLLL